MCQLTLATLTTACGYNETLMSTNQAEKHYYRGSTTFLKQYLSYWILFETVFPFTENKKVLMEAVLNIRKVISLFLLSLFMLKLLSDTTCANCLLQYPALNQATGHISPYTPTLYGRNQQERCGLQNKRFCTVTPTGHQ